MARGSHVAPTCPRIAAPSSRTSGVAGGALAGSRADERQKLLSLRSQALAAKLAAIAAFIGLTIAVAVKAAWWWPFLVILAVAGFGYLLGLSNYGVGEEDPADDANDGHQARSPVTY